MSETLLDRRDAPAASRPPRPEPPIGLLAELTHRCPLRCTYCSNPIELEGRSAELDTETIELIESAATLGPGAAKRAHGQREHEARTTRPGDGGGCPQEAFYA